MSTTNPFYYPNPVLPDAFVGRQNILRDISKALVEDPGASYAIIAGRRLGKTSILMSLAYKLNTMRLSASSHWRSLPIFFDFQSRSFDSPESFYACILNEIRCRVDILAPDKPNDVWPMPITLDSRIRTLCQSAKLTLPDFQLALKQILTQLDKPGNRVRLVLLLDEVDRIIAQGLLDSLGDGLRSLTSSSDVNSRVRLVISGSRKLFDVVTIGSPFLNILRKCHLTTFDKSEIRDLSKKTDKFSENIISAVWQYSGGHPLIAQYLFHHLWASGRKELSEKTIDKYALNFQHEYLDDIEGWARAAGESGLRVYRILSANDGWLSEADIAKQIQDETININHILLNLSCHGIIIHQDWQRYKYSGLVFKKWFDANGTAFINTILREKSLIEGSIKETNESLETPVQQNLVHKEQQSGWPIILISYTLSILFITIAVALIISKIVSTEKFIPFFAALVFVILALLVGVDKLTGDQFLKLVEKLISKIMH
jgi:hypothetical protein